MMEASDSEGAALERLHRAWWDRFGTAEVGHRADDDGQLRQEHSRRRPDHDDPDQRETIMAAATLPARRGCKPGPGRQPSPCR
jgi:hypothetical protein